jgi:gliding motility-associated-like protein
VDPGTGTVHLTSAGFNDVFISKMDTYGELIWAKQMGGTADDLGLSIALDTSRNIYTTGAFGGTVDFDPGLSVYNLTSIGASDIFIHKMSRCTNNNTSSTITVSTCSTYTLNCQVYTSSGVYTQILLNTAGCDSILTLNLTINNTNSTFNVNAAACNSYFWNGQTYTISGTYTDTLIAASGCDSIVTLNLTIKPKLFSMIAQSICSGQTYSGYNLSGTYIDTLVATSGCDSIRTIQLTVLPKPIPDLGADKGLCSGDSLILTPGEFSSYLWQDGTTNNSITVMQPGIYFVVVSNNCGTRKDEILIKEGVCDIFFPSAFTPNNDGKNDFFKALGTHNLNDFYLVVYNRWGQKIFETNDYRKGWSGFVNGQLQNTGVFVWYCEFKRLDNINKTKMKGTVLLIK